ncbi:MAG: hypothetical protein GF331_22940 [Chitinivibrionales bacterium]|nr:hypothetical protein [Chitinivibrionales bacterium]
MRWTAVAVVALFIVARTASGQAEGSLEESFIVEDTGAATGETADTPDPAPSSSTDADMQQTEPPREDQGPDEVAGAQEEAGPQDVQGAQEVDGPREIAGPQGASEAPRVQPLPRPVSTQTGEDDEPAAETPAAETVRTDTPAEGKAAPPVLPLPPEKVSKVKMRRSSRDDYTGFSVGLRLGYFYYAEQFPRDEARELLGIEKVEGQPKSSEYGLCEGLELDLVQRIAGTPLFVRPRLSAFLGLMHQYDGSTQSSRVEGSDTIAVYEPYEMKKNNFFLRAGIEFGGGHFGRALAVTGFTGVDVRLWSRALSRQETEYYSWYNLPVGLALYVNVPNEWRLGLEARAYFMIYGQMHYTFDSPGPFGSDPIEAPPVRLSDEISFGRRVSVRIEVPIQKRLGNAVSLRFYPYFEYYSFGRSNVDSMTIDGDYFYDMEPGIHKGAFYEPASDTYNGGLSVDLVIHFRRRP